MKQSNNPNKTPKIRKTHIDPIKTDFIDECFTGHSVAELKADDDRFAFAAILMCLLVLIIMIGSFQATQIRKLQQDVDALTEKTITMAPTKVIMPVFPDKEAENE